MPQVGTAKLGGGGFNSSGTGRAAYNAAMSANSNRCILKPLWSRRPDGRWAVYALKGINLKPKKRFSSDFFPFESDLELMTSTPPKNPRDLFASFGSTEFLLKQSIVPVVAWADGANTVRCIGTAFVASASGYIVTASHVLLDPQESGYGKVETWGSKGNPIRPPDGRHHPHESCDRC